MKTTIRVACLVTAAVSLSGCQSFPLTSWMFKGNQHAREAAPELAGNTDGALEEGKAFLQAGQLSSAVASFRVAQLDRATQAEASNGLGVAYAKLGRLDLAERYFQAAIMAEPDNTKFTANLLRLQQQVTLARQSSNRNATAVALATPQPRPQPVQQVAVSETRLTGPVERVSRGEVHISTRANLGNAPAMSVAYANPAAANARPAPAAPPAEAQPAQAPVKTDKSETIVFAE